jgi:hypothetical protein
MSYEIDKKAIFKKIGYEPHSKEQWQYHESNARFRIPVCGRRFGKSTMAARDIIPKLLHPQRKGMYWIVGPTYDLGEKEFRVIWNDLIVKAQLGKDKRVKKAYRKNTGEMYIEFPWGTRLEVRSATHPETLVGESLDHVIMSEAAKHDNETFERYIRPALGDRRGGADFPTTPEGFNWLYEMWMLGQNPEFEDYSSWRYPSWTNPIVYPGGRQDAEILLIEKTTSKEWFEQEYAAGFSTFVGRIFKDFDETVHVRNHTFNPLWPNYMTFDWGYANPLAAIEFQVDPMGRVYVWREHYKANYTLQEHIAELKDRDNPVGYHLDLCFGDAADPEAAAYVSQNFKHCVADPMAKTNWRQGIDLVNKKLKLYDTGLVADEFGTPIQEPHLIVTHECVSLIREMNMYRAKPKLQSNANESGTNSVAVKIDDHAVDALRYGLVHIFELGAAHHLTDVETANRNDDNSTFFPNGLPHSSSDDNTFFSLGSVI